ncbi:hypothetical protein, partial [Streptomyces decoyicus]|uniref:hypothetical protein n=1 Tax=Streptomyces decoyicus TaxID=249567 RepID=UPI00362F0AC9
MTHATRPGPFSCCPNSPTRPSKRSWGHRRRTEHGRHGPGLTLDSLPVAERISLAGDQKARGRRRTMKGFRDALT